MTAEEIEKQALPGTVKDLAKRVKELEKIVFGEAEPEPIPSELTDVIEFNKTITDPQVSTEAEKVAQDKAAEELGKAQLDAGQPVNVAPVVEPVAPEFANGAQDISPKV